MNKLPIKTAQRKISGGRMVLYVCAVALALFWLVPLVWMFLVTFKEKNSAVTVLPNLLRPPFTLDNYREVMDSAVWVWMKNSLIVGVVSTLGALLIDSLAAFALSYLQYPGRNAVFWFIMLAMMVPIEAQIVPMYQVMVEFGLMNTYLSIILPSLAGPFGVFILKQFYDGIPRALAEAARIDGAGYWRIFWNIYVPLSRSSLIAVGLFIFIGSWNDFLWPFMALTSDSRMTVPVGLPMFNSLMGTDMVMPMTACFVASIPTIVLYLFFQKHIIKGVAMTGLKG